MARAEWVKVQGSRKGKPGIWAVNGLYVLRWSYGGKSYTLYLGHDRLGAAHGLADKVAADMASGHFDPTLEAYKPKLAESEPKLAECPRSTGELWQAYTESKRATVSGQRIAAVYEPILANLRRYGRDIEDKESAQEFINLLRSRQSVLIANQNLSLLKSFGDWCVKQEHWQVNHFADIPPAKGGIRPRKNPFTADEVKQILATIKTDADYWHYHDFAFCLLHLGCRPSELIGLRWGHIDFNRRVITICESLSRGDDGKTAGYARKRKETKTANIRYLPLTEAVFNLLAGRFRDVQPQSPDELVFTAPRGGAIDDHNFSQRCWRSICQRAGIPYRSPYIARHTALSHIVESTGSLAQAAAVAGHSSLRMVSQTYGHLVSKIQMPEYE